MFCGGSTKLPSANSNFDKKEVNFVMSWRPPGAFVSRVMSKAIAQVGSLLGACIASDTLRKMRSAVNNTARLAAFSFQISPTTRRRPCRVVASGTRLRQRDGCRSFFKIFSPVISFCDSRFVRPVARTGAVQWWQVFNALRSSTYTSVVSASFVYAWTW